MSKKIIDGLLAAAADDRTTFSFEFFPPKTDAGVINLYDRLERMYGLGPSFIDVTWGAGGSTADLTLEICHTAQTSIGNETMMHLTCTNMSREMVDSALTRAREIGIRNILALRGDPPRGQLEWTAHDNGFAHAVDLVRHIRKIHGDWFCVSVAGYPEGHSDCKDMAQELRFLKEKVDAGADFIVTQLFYDTDLFLAWVQQCRAAGITCPILPGIMPIMTYSGFVKMTTLSNTTVPSHIHEALAPIKDDEDLVKSYGVRLAADMCRQLRDAGLRHFHFYTLNLEKSVRLILEELQWSPPLEDRRPLPWNPSRGKGRAGETVRPVFWKNRQRSYISRTAEWDEYPNGRWGDARSPAFGELDGYGVSLKHSKEKALALWGTPHKLDDLYTTFADYCAGKVKALPWSDQPLAGESLLIRDQLERVNRLGFLTINSQPPVDGKPSSDPVVGWGPKNGWVYQKAYLEFFISPAALEALLAHLAKVDKDGIITYHVVTRTGGIEEVRTNHEVDAVNAVTWGVFPGKEVVQPTIVDLASFMAWRDEAYLLWDSWAAVYDAGSAERALVQGVAADWCLMTLVDNDFTAPKEALFDVLAAAAAALSK
ncbi:methylenetetrahydrofolate reductase-domain-containing protein [Blastocladiella britannica]|nr:methylenetetrahydrofolate reductase-domain-containing protein [Blastocladiella britannica]